MQQTSELWKSLLAMRGTTRAFKFSVDGVEMDENSESGHSVALSLLDELSIGNAVSASLSYQVWADSITAGQKIERFVRLENGSQASEWLPAGVFFVNTADVEDGLWNVEAVDAIRKANVPWSPSQDLEFPMPMDKVMELTAAIVGVEIDPRSEFEATYHLDYPTEGYTIRNLWQYVAAAHGGNIIITPAGKLRLVRMYGDRDLTNVVEGDYTSLTDNGKRPPVSRVTIMRDQSNGDTAGDDTGTEIKGTCFTADQAMVDDILGRLKDIEYQAYSCSAAGLDPAAELGDAVDFGELQGIIFRIDDDGYGFPNLSCPGERMIDEKYPDDGPLTSEMKREIGKARSEITKTAQEISLEVSGYKSTTDAALDSIQGQLEQAGDRIGELEQKAELSVTQSEVAISIKEAVDGINSVTTETGATFDKNGLTIEQSESNTVLTADSTGFHVKDRSGGMVMDVSNGNVDTKNIRVSTYLTISDAFRIEETDDGHGALYWTKG